MEGAIHSVRTGPLSLWANRSSVVLYGASTDRAECTVSEEYCTEGIIDAKQTIGLNLN